ncbi:hypothetical protein [Candidatus Nitrososphaera sp. FF02]|uniref:hypothetical protein n=1 Tax=Candidatus Nitrososphaera sp. FF02 TaxID=3398226 RepID=UPI0039E86F1C
MPQQVYGSNEGMEQYQCGPLTPCAYDLVVNGTSYPVTYSLFGEIGESPDNMKLNSITADLENKAISASVESDQGGHFSIAFDRDVTKALGLDRDADFVVLANGEQIERGISTFRGEDEADDTTQIDVEFEAGDTNFLIGDPRVIPEFSIVAPIVAVATAAAILASRRNVFARFRRDV